MNGYECVWLRTYYTIEFVAAYLNRAENEDDTINGIELARINNIEIKPIKFGKSDADYAIDRKENCIYKGIESIKYCNATIAHELLIVANEKHYNSFIELLDSISDKTSVNARQLKILTSLNFFSDFGKNQRLLGLIDLYSGVKDEKTKKNLLPSIRTCSQIKKDKLENYSNYGITEFLVKKYSGKETPKQYSNIDNIGLLTELIEKIPDKSMSIQQQCKVEKEYLQYVVYTNPKINECYYIVVDYTVYKDVTKPYVTLRNINTGKETKTKIKQSKIYRDNPFGLFSILRINDFAQDYKGKYDVNGDYIRIDELELVLKEYEVIKQ